MIMGTEEDGSKSIKPPNLSKHTEWDCVYIQSRDLDRELSSGTTYLFCENIQQHWYNIDYLHYDTYDRCNDGPSR